MAKIIGKMQTTDADNIVAYGEHIATSQTDSTPLTKRIPYVFYAFSTTKNYLYKSAEDLAAGIGVAYTEIPVNTIVFMSGEGNAYIRLPNRLGSPNWQPLSSNESKIFTNEEDAREYAATIGKVGEIITVIDSANNEVLVYKIDIGNVLSDVATSFLIQLYSTEENMSYTLTSGQPITVGFIYNEKYGTDSTRQPGTITYQIKRPSDESIVTVSSPHLTTTIRCTTGEEGTDYFYNPVFFNPADYGYDLEVGINTITITVTGGESKKSKTITYNVNVIDMYVVADGFDDSTVKITSAITYPWRCYGSGVNKTVIIKVTNDATGETKTLDPIDVANTSGNSRYTSINLAQQFGLVSSEVHGTFTLEQYCIITETIGTENEIRSDSIYFNIMVCAGTNIKPLISATCDKTSIDYGDNIVVRYSVYSYNASTEYRNTVKQILYYYTEAESTEDGALFTVADEATPGEGQIRCSDTGIEGCMPDMYVKRVDYSELSTQFQNNAAKAVWNVTDYPDSSIAKVIFLELSCENGGGKTVKTFMITMGDVSGDYDLNPAAIPCFCYLTSSGKTNSDNSRNIWRSTNENGFTCNAKLTNFNFISNGWVDGDDGATCLRVSGTAKCTIPLTMSDNYMYYENDSESGKYALEQSESISGSGRTIIIDMNIHDILNFSTECITWFSPADGRGIRVTPQAAYLVNEIFSPDIDSSGAINNKDDIPFVQIKDNERIELAIVIESLGASAGPQNTVQFIRMYLNGELSKAISFTNYAFNQRSLPAISIGSTDAIVDIYSIRYYSTALRDYEVLQNYISGRPTIKDKMAAYDENAIYSEAAVWSPDRPNGTTSGIAISYDKAKKVYPCFLVTGQLSPIKGQKTKVGIIFTKPANNADGFVTELNCMDYYTQGDSVEKKYLCETNVQGTSSQIYAKKNYKYKFTNLKKKSYQDKISYYVKDADNPSRTTLCNFIEFDFGNWYGPGNEEYWVRLANSAQSDTYDPTSTYHTNDIVYFRGGQYQAIQDCNFTGGGDPDDLTTCVFAPYIIGADVPYLIQNTNIDAPTNGRYYYVPSGESFYYRTESDSTVGSWVITDDRVLQTAALQENPTTGALSVNISLNDEIETSKTKYKLYPGEKHKGGEESTFCVKADYMSPDGINSDNGRMFPQLFTELVPPQHNNPYAADNDNVFIAIPGYRALMFRRDTETSEPEFIGRYNFNYDKGNTKSFGLEYDGDEDDVGITNNTKAQKWEYLDNKDDICNFRSYKIYQPVEDTIAAYSALESCYPDQGDLEDIGRSPDYTDIQVLYSWVLQRANFWNASSDAIAVPYEYNGQYYYNERAYRKAIFINEFERHFNKTHAITYHICIETMAVVDNRAKNMFLTCYDRFHDTNMYSALLGAHETTANALTQSTVNIKFTSGSVASINDLIDHNTGDFQYNMIDWENSVFPIWYTSLYDMDSCAGVDNNGKNRYNYDVEIHDIYNYDSQGNPTYCFNGAESWFWCMVEEAFAADIAAKWQELRSITNTKLSYEILCAEYMDRGADTVPQVVYNEDQRFKYMDILTHGYIDVSTNQLTTTSIYQYLCQGSKRFHKRWFLENRMAFLDSKYKSPQYRENNISFRINRGMGTTPEDVAIDVTPFITQYQYIAYGNVSEDSWVGGKCLAGNTIHIKPAQGGVFQDIVTSIYGASNIADLGDLSGQYLSKLSLRAATHLKSLVLGSHDPSYNNPNLVTSDINVSSCKLLQKIDLTNCHAVTGEIDLSTCQLLQEVYAYGTDIRDIILPNGGSLRILNVPASTSTLRLQNQHYIESLSFEGMENLTKLIIEDSGGSGLNVPDIIMNSPNLSSARLTNVNWVLPDKTVLNKLMSCSGIAANGTTETDKCVLTGQIVVNEASSVNESAWAEYWAAEIATGDLTITVKSRTNFHYVTYNSYTNVTEIGYDSTNDSREVVKKSPADASACYWYTELQSDTWGNGSFTSYAKFQYQPALTSKNGVRLMDATLPKVKDRIEVKMNTDGVGYWCIDGLIVTYSPTDYDVCLYPVAQDSDGEISDDAIAVMDSNGAPIKFRRIIRDDYWQINGQDAINYSTVRLKAVLKDSKGNIVYTAKNMLRAVPINNGLWADTSDDGTDIRVYDNGRECNTADYTAWLVQYSEICTEFVDDHENSIFKGQYPTQSGSMFSHWTPSELNITENKDIYATFIEGYTEDEITETSFFGFVPVKYDILGNVTGLAICNANIGALQNAGRNKIVIPATYTGNTTAVGSTPSVYVTNCPIIAVGDPETRANLGGGCFSTAKIATGSSIKSIYFQVGSKVETFAPNAFSDFTGLEKVIIPDTVTTIGANAFYNVTAQIVWTGTPRIESIGSYAFARYSGIASGSGRLQMDVPSQPSTRSIPDSIKRIEDYAFEYSSIPISWADESGLTYIGNYAFRGSTALSFVFGSKLVEIGQHAFDSATAITSITLPNSLKKLGAYAFNGCTALANVTVIAGSDIEVIGTGKTVFDNTAFAGSYSSAATHTEANHWYGTSDNKVLYLSDNSDANFENCVKFLLCAESTADTVTVKSETHVIAEEAFADTAAFATVTFDSSAGTKYINRAAFRGTNITSATLPASVKIISEYAFEGCGYLEDLTVGSSLEEIGDYAFANCDLGNLMISVSAISLSSIGNYAFYNNSSMEEIELPENIQYIGDFAFNRCNAVGAVKVPYTGRTPDSHGTYDSVLGYLFGYQINANEVKIGDNLSGKTIYLDKTLLDTSDDFEDLESAFTCVADDGETVMAKIEWDGTQHTASFMWKNTSADVSFQQPVVFYNNGTWAETAFTLPAGEFHVSVCGSEAFTDPIFVYNKEYTDLRLENNIEPTVQHFGPGEDDYEEYYIPSTLIVVNIYNSATIKYGACENIANLETLHFSNLITKIEDYAFNGCSSLVSLQDFSTIAGLIEIGNSAFEDCESIVSITLPPTVTTIGARCFANCSGMTAINIPVALVNIGYDAFLGCTSLNYNASGNINFLGNTTNRYLWAIKAVATNRTSYELDTNTVGIYSGCLEDCNNFTTFRVTGNIQVIGDKVFKGCTALGTINCDDSNQSFKSSSGILYSYDMTELIAYPAGKQNATASSLDNNLRKIRPYACYGVQNSMFNITNPITEIGEYAFYNCAGVNILTISEEIVDITDNMFYGCTRADIDFGGSLRSLGQNSFYGCRALKAPTLANTVTSIPENCFRDCVKLIEQKNFVIPASVNSIGPNAFKNVSSGVYTVYFELGSQFTNLTTRCFAGLDVKTMNIPETCTVIGEYAFEEAGFQSIIIPNAVTTISTGAFKGCPNLSSVTIGTGVNSIASKAFYACSALSTVNISSGNPSNIALADVDAFARNPVDRLFIVPNGASETFMAATNWQAYELLILDDDDFKHGITTLKVQFTSSNPKPSVGFTKFTTHTTERDNVSQQDVEVDKHELTTVIWGDKIWRGPGNTDYWTKIGNIDTTETEDSPLYDSTEHYGVGDQCAYGKVEFRCIKAHDPEDDEAYEGCYSWTKMGSPTGVSVSFPRSSYSPKDNLITGRDIEEYVYSNHCYFTRITSNQGVQSTEYVVPGYDIPSDASGEYTIKILNRGTWKANGAITGSNSLIKEAVVDANITEFGGSMFSGASGMTAVTLPDIGSKYTSVGTSFFSGCSSLENVKLPASIVTIGNNAFDGCTVLGSINTNQLVTIGTQSFRNCRAITSVRFEEIETLGANSFNGCSNLKKVVIDKICTDIDLPSVGTGAFS